MRTKLIIAIITAAVGLSLGTAKADLVQDGGFESAPRSPSLGVAAPASLGDGWDVTAGSAFILNGSSAVGAPHSGTQFAYLDGYFTLNTLSQTLATVVGQSYTVSFYAADTAPDLLDVTFGGAVLFDGTAPTNGVNLASDYVLETFNVTATATSTVLAFSGQYTTAAGSGTLLDDVSVTPLATAPVPEPSSLLLVGAGITGLAMRRNRRRCSRP